MFKSFTSGSVSTLLEISLNDFDCLPDRFAVTVSPTAFDTDNRTHLQKQGCELKQKAVLNLKQPNEEFLQFQIVLTCQSWKLGRQTKLFFCKGF